MGASQGERPPEPLPRSEAKRITLVQKRLSELGYEAGPIDGILGPRTRAAIKAFQRAKGLGQDGKPSRKLLKAVRKNSWKKAR